MRMCLYPKLIRNKKYTSNKKNGGVIPAISDERTKLVPVGCGKCIECMNQKKRNWQIRLLEEVRNDRTGKFVTLTFSDISLEYLKTKTEFKQKNIEENEVATKGVRYFLENWRKEFGKSVKHWLVTELGQEKSQRIHIHGIIFTDKDNDTIKRKWNWGHVWIGQFVNEKTINYIVKYINKPDVVNKGYMPKVLTSKGMGAGYIKRSDSKKNKYKGTDTIEYYRTKDGSKINLPIYYRNKLYSEQEREKLWLKKLDEEIRYVCGEKIDISNGEEEYYKVLEHYRSKNKRIGYGDDSKDWNVEEYKRKRNTLRQQKYRRKRGV